MSKFKRRSSNIFQSKEKWRPVTIKGDGFEGGLDDFKGLVALEELTDYQWVAPKSSKKRKASAKESDSDIDSNFEGSDSGDDRSSSGNSRKKAKAPSKKKDKKKKNKKKSVATDKKSKTTNPDSADSEQGRSLMNETTDGDFSAWNALMIDERIMKALKEGGFTSPTRIQYEAIPPAIRQRMDVFGAAETGSGKTLAFGIPLLTFIMKDKSQEELDNGMCEKKLRGLVLAPTRELAMQVRNHLQFAAKYTGVTISAIVGGMAVQKQERILKKMRPDILVATPGRLWEFIQQDDIPHVDRKSIFNVKYIVVDEADRMAEKGHFEDLKKLFEFIKEKEAELKQDNDDDENLEERFIPVERQTFVFSATLTLTHDAPRRLKRHMTKKHLKKLSLDKLTPEQKIKRFMDEFNMREGKTKIIDLTVDGVTAPTELQEFKIECLEDDKDTYLYYYISMNPGRTLVFCNSKDSLRRLTNILRMLQMNPVTLHASMPQKMRLRNLDKFTKTPNSLLIASDVAARGLDIPRVDHVVHYQVPRTAEIYIHRSGRTARAQNPGTSLLLCTPKEEAAFFSSLWRTLNREEPLKNYHVDQHVFKHCKERVNLARQVDVMDHRLRKNKAEESWIKKMANDADIELESDIESEEDEKQQAFSKEKKKFESLQKHLRSLLQKPIIVKKSKK